MYLSQQPNQSSAHFGPSLTSSYDQRQQYNSETKNPEGRSLLTGPIPASPGFEFDPRARSAPCDYQRIVRVRGTDAKLNYKRANASTGVPFLFQVQGSRVFSASGLATKPPTNHLNENVKRMRHIMRDSRQRQATNKKPEPIPAKELWHSKQYDNVQSKVKQKLDEDTQRSLSRPQSAQGAFLRAHENTGPQVLQSQSVSNSRRGSVAESVNLTTTQTNGKIKPDYVKINSQYVKHIPQVRKSASAEAVEEVQQKTEIDLKKYRKNQKGRVPDYIERIKEKRSQDIYEERANAPDIDCPPGHVKVDNNQRVTTLQQLQSNRAELEKKLGHLPIRNDSVTLRRAKEEIEKKIIELDEAIKIFSKPKVFIGLEE